MMVSDFIVYKNDKRRKTYKGNIYATGWGEREYSRTYYGSKYYFVRCCVANHDHLCFIVQSDDSGSVEKVLDSVDYDCFFFDVVADPANMDFYLLVKTFEGDNYELWRLHCNGSTLKAPKKVQKKESAP
ncbi:MAG: hypothetical protein K6A64_10320 [Bacteroidales bacterium]|nr:hypothetical protein [Bacteroidales bacterium]